MEDSGEELLLSGANGIISAGYLTLGGNAMNKDLEMIKKIKLETRQMSLEREHDQQHHDLLSQTCENRNRHSTKGLKLLLATSDTETRLTEG